MALISMVNSTPMMLSLRRCYDGMMWTMTQDAAKLLTLVQLQADIIATLGEATIDAAEIGTILDENNDLVLLIGDQSTLTPP